MNIKVVVKKAQNLREKTRRRRADSRYKNTIGFFRAKGLLFAESIRPKPNVKLDINDVLWVADKVEPRVLEVLPAALVHFPKTFLNLKELPKQLQEIVAAIKKKQILSIDYNGIEYKKMYHWADKVLSDQRVKPVSQKRVLKTFRLKPEVIDVLEAWSQRNGQSQTNCLEEAVLALELKK